MSRMTESELNEFASRFTSDYMDTVYVCCNIFRKTKDGRKIGVRWALTAKHGDDKYLLFFGDTTRGKKKGTCIARVNYGGYNANYVIDTTPDKVRKWCESICCGSASFSAMTNQVGEDVWQDVVSW